MCLTPLVRFLCTNNKIKERIEFAELKKKL